VKTLAIARRELLSYFFSPISWVVMTLFLVATGWEFWLLVAMLNGRAAPHGAVLQYFFGGTFLYWLFLMFIVAVIAMRLVAEERRAGTLEPLLTAPVSELDVVLGKYLGALAFYAALWVPTFIYVLILRSYAPVQAGPVAAGYLGTLLVGAGALALGLFASTVTRNQIIAAVLAFVTLAVLLLLGAVGDTQMRGNAALQYINLFRHMEDFGRGIVDSRRLVHHLSLVVLGLYASARMLAPSRRAAVEILLVAAILAGVNVLSARHFLRGDWTRGRTFSLSDKTRNLLHALHDPVEVVVFMLPGGENDLYDDVRELLDRAARETPRLKVDWVDIDRDRERALTVAKRYNVAADDVTNGVIIVQGQKEGKVGPPRFIPRSELAEYDLGDPPSLQAWKGEQALMSAILQVTEEKPPEICFVQGHGEPAIDSWEQGEYGDFAEELRRDHYTVRAVDLEAPIAASCNLVVQAGPDKPLDAAQIAVLSHFLDGGGRLLVLAGPHFDPQVTRFADTGLEKPLASFGLTLGSNVIVDQPPLAGSAVAFAVSEGYADHPVTAHLMHQRTLWSTVREVRGPVELVHTSDAGWGETDLGIFHAAAELAFDPARDKKGPLSIGAAAQRGRTRIVAFGSSEIAGNREILGYNRDLLLSSVAWLLDAPPRLALGPRTPEHVRLRLDDGQLTRVFLLSVVALPLLVLLLGAGVWWVRRS
jgi:ABC-type transport system involved in multi-copper enzyme maturation permease subunit